MDNNHLDQNIFDAQGFRFNVGIIIINEFGQVFLGKRCGQNSWQFPQGGLNAGESTIEAMWRELYEETGLTQAHVEVVGATSDWLKYRLPIRFRRRRRHGLVQCIGQKQKWFLLRLKTKDVSVNLTTNPTPEFDDWRWADYWEPVNEVVYFKRKVYRHALNQLKGFIPEHHALIEQQAEGLNSLSKDN